MKSKKTNLTILILSLICLFTSTQTLYNIGVFVDEYNMNPSMMLGGELWIYMSWIKIIINGVICLMLGVNLIKKY